MHYHPMMEEFMERQMEREEQLRREREIHQAIHERLLRLNEEELKAVLQFTKMVYRNSEERAMYINAGYPEWNLE